MAKIITLDKCPKCNSAFILCNSGYFKSNYCSNSDCCFMAGEKRQQIILDEGESFRNYTLR